jgi:membrane-associated phospholipid phosphatase
MAAIQPHVSLGSQSATAVAGRDGRALARRLTAGWRGQWLVFLAAYLAYSAGRWLFIGDLPTATANARDIVDFERSLGVFVEGPVQNSLDSGAVVWSLNKIYMLAQMVILPGALVWLYRANRRVYRVLRDTVLGTWLLSLPIYALFPVAPPRLAGVGIGDTMAGPDGSSEMTGRLATKFFNPLAAVPSLHTGFAFAVGIALAFAFRRRWAQGLALLWGPLIALTVVATGNHFVFDVAAGILVTVAGYGIARVSLAIADSPVPLSARVRSALRRRSRRPAPMPPAPMTATC